LRIELIISIALTFLVELKSKDDCSCLPTSGGGRSGVLARMTSRENSAFAPCSSLLLLE
jgi:hypothetical protein